eukprot:g20807.t1
MGSGKRRRERAKRSAKRSWNRDFSLPERSSKRYQTYFFIRASHASNKRERGYFLDRFDTIQIPDVLRIVPRRRAGTRITNNHATKKRTVFKDEARRRGLKTKIHEMILFTRAEMVAMLASATAEGERFVEQGDLREAAKLEMRYALSQGIIEKKPTLEDTYLTLKCWFLFSASPEFAGCTLTLNREEFWGDVVDIAVRGHAAVSVVDVFKDSGHQLIACEWAKGILQELVNVDVPMAAHFFLKPMFGCDDEGPGSEEGGVDISKATGADVAWPEICVDGPPIQSRITVRAHDSVAAKVACVVAKLSVTTDGDEPYENVDLMIEVIRECLRSWDRKCVVEYEPVPADGPEYDADLVWKAFELFASHSKMRAYANKVKKSWQVPEEPNSKVEEMVSYFDHQHRAMRARHKTRVTARATIDPAGINKKVSGQRMLDPRDPASKAKMIHMLKKLGTQVWQPIRSLVESYDTRYSHASTFLQISEQEAAELYNHVHRAGLTYIDIANLYIILILSFSFQRSQVIRQSMVDEFVLVPDQSRYNLSFKRRVFKTATSTGKGSLRPVSHFNMTTEQSMIVKFIHSIGHRFVGLKEFAPTRRLLLNSNAQGWTQHDISTRFKYIGKQWLGISNFGAHNCRTFWSTDALRSGVVNADNIAEFSSFLQVSRQTMENSYMSSTANSAAHAVRKTSSDESEIQTDDVNTYGGHATQILWKSSKQLGCVTSDCTSGGSPRTYLVCQYNPPGNYYGRREALRTEDMAEILTMMKATGDSAWEEWLSWPLNASIASGNVKMFTRLLDAGADPDVHFSLGKTIVQDKPEMFSMLLARGADRNVQCEWNGKTPLLLALSEASDRVPAAAWTLLDAGARVDLRDDDNMSSLDCAARIGDIAFMQAIIDRGVNVNETGFEGRTALHHAVEYDRFSAVDMLIEAGANIESVDEAGHTPLALAMDHYR